MSIRSVYFVSVTLLFIASPAFASGIPMAEEWTWTRDGSRILNSLLVFGALTYVIIKYVAPVFKRRADLIAERIANLEEASATADKSLAEYERKLKDIETESEKIKEEARQEGEMIRNKIVEQAKLDADKIVEKAKEQIDIETQNAKSSLRRQTAKAAIDLAENILKNNVNPDDRKRLLENYISGMEKKN